MSDKLINIMWGIFSSLMGFFLGWWGSKVRIQQIEHEMESMHQSVRFTDTCDERYNALGIRLQNIEEMNKEIRNDIKTLLKNK